MLTEVQINKIADEIIRQVINIENMADEEAFARMQKQTIARIGVGKCGPRLKTKTMLQLRADHAAARDAVRMDVPESLLERMDLLLAETKCSSKDEFLTRPDLGRQLTEDSVRLIQEKCISSPDIQIYASDGLSSTAITANLEDILPVVTDILKQKGLKVGTPFFLKNGRVAAMDQISELLQATVTCVLIGERPGLATAESMSAYIAYKATVGMPEARRTVVSNIHSKGIPAVEAGAYLADVMEQMLKLKVSGVDLKK